MKYVQGLRQGPFGREAVVNYNPMKTCSFNCVYCPFGATTNITTKRQEFAPCGDIVAALEETEKANGPFDGVWFICTGEPLLYVSFGRLTECIQQRWPSMKTGVYTNGSLLSEPSVRSELSTCDTVIMNLNSIVKTEFLRINRPHCSFNLVTILSGLETFSTEYQGDLLIDTVLVKGLNDTVSGLQGLRDVVTRLSPRAWTVKSVRGYRGQNAIAPVDEAVGAMLSEGTKDLPFTTVITL